MSGFELAALAAVGVIAGWINTLAGGGSMLTLPALMFFGLPADVANATNRVAIVAQCATGVHRFHRRGALALDLLGKIVAPTLVGAALGAYLATRLPNAVFRPVLLISMMAMAFTLVVRPSFLKAGEGEAREPGSPATVLALFGTGFFGGFVQAGVGFLLIAVLVGMLRVDLVRANGLKLALVLVFTSVAVAIFVWRGHIAWPPALALALGNSAGAWLGVQFAVERGAGPVRRVVFVTVLSSCVWLLIDSS